VTAAQGTILGIVICGVVVLVARAASRRCAQGRLHGSVPLRVHATARRREARDRHPTPVGCLVIAAVAPAWAALLQVSGDVHPDGVVGRIVWYVFGPFCFWTAGTMGLLTIYATDVARRRLVFPGTGDTQSRQVAIRTREAADLAMLLSCCLFAWAVWTGLEPVNADYLVAATVLGLAACHMCIRTMDVIMSHGQVPALAGA